MRPLILIAALVLAAAATAAPPAGFQLIEGTNIGDHVVGRTVLQQSPSFCDPASPDFDFARDHECVHNPTGCLWDIDDTWTVSAVARKIEAGAVASKTTCAIWDTRVPFWGLLVRAESPSLHATLHFKPHNVTWSLDPMQIGRGVWEYRGCLFGPYDPNFEPEIPGSNGGHGLQGSVTVTVANPTGKFAQNPVVSFIGRPGVRPDYCNGPTVDYGLWSAAGLIPEVD